MAMPQTSDLATSTRNRLYWAAHSAGLLACLWIALNGLSDLLPGLFFVLLGAGLGAWLVPLQAWPWRPWRLLIFALWFLKASWQGGLDVAWRAMQPTMPLQPTILEHEMALPRGLPQTVFIAILNLLPGSLSLAMDADGKCMRIHVLTPDALPGILELEARLATLFALPAGSAAK